jgi:hypothetical protein
MMQYNAFVAFIFRRRHQLTCDVLQIVKEDDSGWWRGKADGKEASICPCICSFFPLVLMTTRPCTHALFTFLMITGLVSI